MDMPAILLRFGNYAILSLIAGVPLFLWLACGAEQGRAVLHRLRIGFGLLLIAAMLLTILAFLAMAAAMAAAPILPVDWDIAALVLQATAVGKAMLARLILLALCVPLAVRAALRPIAAAGVLAAITLAWGGHAGGGEGVAGWIHLFADMIHIAAAATWIGGMACLLFALWRPDAEIVRPILRAFAPIGGGAVALLVLTGLVNGAMIVGVERLPLLLQTVYGQLMAAKIAAFGLMLLLAANNRFRLTPLYERQPQNARPALRRAVSVELAIALAILLLVGWLGMIDPGAAG